MLPDWYVDLPDDAPEDVAAVEASERARLDKVATDAQAHIDDLRRRIKNVLALDLTARGVMVDVLLEGTPRVWVNGKECVEVDQLTVPM